MFNSSPPPKIMKVPFTINGQHVQTDQEVLKGLAIKQLGHEKDPSLDITHELVLEGGGPGGADKVIGDDDEVDFRPDHVPGHAFKAFFTRPPTNFGGV